MVAIANALNYIIYNQLLLKYIYIYKKKMIQIIKINSNASIEKYRIYINTLKNIIFHNSKRW